MMMVIKVCVCVRVCACTLVCEIIFFSEGSRQPASGESSSEVHKEMDSTEPHQSEHLHHKQADQVIPGSKVCPGTFS